MVAAMTMTAVHAETLYLTKSDTSSNKGETSFNKWNIADSGTEAPKSSNDYVVDGGFTMRFPNGGASNGGFSWPGNSLRIGTAGGKKGTVVFTRTNNNNTWLTTTYMFNYAGLILEKGIIQPWTRNTTNTITGTITVTAPENEPFDVQLGAQSQHSNSVLRIGGTLKGASGTALRVYSNTPDSGAAFHFAPTTPNAFAGKIIVGNSKNAIVCAADNNKMMVGGFVITKGASLAPPQNDKKWTVGSLELQGGSFIPPNSGTKWTVGDLRLGEDSTLLTKVAVANTSTITITNSLTTTYPVNLTTPDERTSTASTSASMVWPVLTLPTDKGDLGDNVGDFVLATQSTLFPDSLPAVYLSVSTNGTLASLNLVQRQIVRLNESNALTKWATTGYQTAVTNAAMWSDNAVPHSDADYVVDTSGRSLCFPPRELLDDGKTYEFPGSSLTLGAGNVNLYSGAATTRIPILRMTDDARYWPACHVSSETVTLEGDAIHLLATGNGQSYFRIYGNRLYVVNAPLAGAGRLTVFNNSSSGSPAGTIVFRGDNSGFTGRIRLSGAARNDVYTTNTLLVEDGTQLGGALDSFADDALELCYGSTIAATNDAVFATTNRGLYVNGSGKVDVAADALFTLGCDITYSDGATFAKTGAGTLALAGNPRLDGATPKLDVQNGCIKAMSTNALNGVAVTFADGAYLLVDPVATGDVAAFGAVDLSATPFGGALPVAFDLPALAGNQRYRYSGVAVCTVADAAKAAALTLEAKKIQRHSVSFSTRANADGTVTVVADINAKGLVLVIR